MGVHPLVSAWVVGHKVCCPPVKLRVPLWDLQAILVALMEKWYEPLRQVEMERLTYRTLFLVALASAHCVSELHALSVELPFMIKNPQSFNLAVSLAFLPKTNIDVTLDVDIERNIFVPDLLQDMAAFAV